MSRQLETLEVLLIEDDPMVQEVNRQFIEKVPPYKVQAIASNGKEGVALASRHNPQLIVIDVYMPELDGVETLKELRANGVQADVIAITASKEKETIRTMYQYGVIDYIIKPFKFERLQHALEKYRTYRTAVIGNGELSQTQLDELFESTVPAENKVLPKGLNEQTLKQVVHVLKSSPHPLSAEEAAEAIGAARVTARRYLEYLQKEGSVVIDIQYGTVGRPVNRYRIKP
ncbi:response regulator [Halobacillus kuroshimensis]|uniref:Response regulator n=1 Tax=Halobacillus kuroshimensis TaxID=302481 RepID=A0ABS3DV85_9BACI|nr:response regulator [Halobacillus kuroshimensis]MBN8235258.1 response regulator [Halobacillus kuroshimensis]